MFARILEITPKAEKREELINVVRQEILPILKKQPGFIELMPFVPEFNNEKVVAISLWAEKYDAERYAKEVFPTVEKTLKPFLAFPITYRPYRVETTVCQHLAEVLTAAV